jgi:glycosyltransferase involved in cell wall biosynthesis
VFDQLIDVDILDEWFLSSAPPFRRLLYGILPGVFAQTLEAIIVSRKYDAVVSWSEPLGILYAFLRRISFSRVPHVALFSWISRPKKAFLIRLMQPGIDKIVMWSSAQYNFAINKLGIPPAKVHFTSWLVDQKFWRPIDAQAEMICSAGSEMRDYPTLIKAMKGLDIRCHIAGGTHRNVVHKTVAAIEDHGPLPANVSVGRKSFAELRDLYARSRFVVVPLLDSSETDNGVTVILEAMAMGKAVICSRTRGQVDVIEHGKTGWYVPAGDPVALREAILYLWNNTEVAKTIGERGRQHVLQRHTHERFVEDLSRVIREEAGRKMDHPFPYT